jgi:hypothetical protein
LPSRLQHPRDLGTVLPGTGGSAGPSPCLFAWLLQHTMLSSGDMSSWSQGLTLPPWKRVAGLGLGLCFSGGHRCVGFPLLPTLALLSFPVSAPQCQARPQNPGPAYGDKQEQKHLHQSLACAQNGCRRLSLPT